MQIFITYIFILVYWIHKEYKSDVLKPPPQFPTQYAAHLQIFPLPTRPAHHSPSLEIDTNHWFGAIRFLPE